ncbi:MAG: hypothetical protein Q8928_16775 [Bacteroidota bacterium]|nr:hypothetical protein [Bacteroidota bacterium]
MNPEFLPDPNSIIITRKIRIFIDVPENNKEKGIEFFNKLKSWQTLVFKASNLVSSHLFIQAQAKELIYLQEDVKFRLTNRKLDEKGMLNTSFFNSTYKLISQKFKKELPSAIITCLNHNIFSTFSKEKAQYSNGERSLRSYKSTIPVPFTSESLYDLKYNRGSRNFTFTLFKSQEYQIPLRTFLGRDLSNNKFILEKCLTNEYKLCNSSYLIKENKIYLLLTIKIPPQKHDLNYDTTAYVSLSFLAPIIVKINDKSFNIGDTESFLYKRLAIQQGLKRRQQLMKFNNGGKGREKKTLAIKQFRQKEKQFIDNFTHKLSYDLVNFCISNKIGKLELKEVNQNIEEAYNYPIVIRNWSFGSLLDKIEYKCKMKGIILTRN